MKAVVPPVSCVRACRPALVERLERQHPGRDRRHVPERLHRERVADLAEQPGGEAGPEQHEDRDAVGGGGQEHRAEQRQCSDHEHTQHQPCAGAHGVVRPPIAGDPGDDHRADVDRRHVERAHECGARVTSQQQARPTHRPHDDRLEQPSLRVAAHRAEREEDGEHGSEEESREHREPEERGSGEHAVVELVVRRDGVHLVEGELRAERVEREEAGGEHEHHEDHAPADRLAQGVAGHDQGSAHAAPTASR